MTLNDAERAELLPTRRLRAAVAVGPAKSALWTVRNEASEPEGVTVVLSRAPAERIGASLELVVHNSGEIIKAAECNVSDVGFSPRRFRVQEEH